MAQEALGRLFDISAGIVPVDSQTAAMTGKRVSLKNAGGCTIVVFKAAGTANDDPVLDLQQHTAASGGTTADLDIIDHYYIKQEATLDGDETWTRVTQSAASEVTLNSTSAETQMIVVIEVDARSLSDGYDYISLDIADTGSAGAQLISCLYLLRDLAVQRTPANLIAPLS
ncbi:hypothetical protein PV755_45395 [Streptomyces caniscabiei]|uniref:Uncharacterized protein n=1 Tax=Streptomyces caniscabiei TaxID=2746961 RepID=A0A927QFC7_9ACTN|nr:hypothetical protein [Streptomyces caniscabiei]MBD9723450.1 hypothetical protein [Streptomyces caniscabiei]MDX3516052.1 hypothetical protein [Streptomyces caniscabiei]MDX3725142.1 hypothetical protein [Streptomyces caniscabiei]WEO27020.1 hypothetical protein IHE65_29835 [Streptomyces caniscabiei]